MASSVLKSSERKMTIKVNLNKDFTIIFDLDLKNKIARAFTFN